MQFKYEIEYHPNITIELIYKNNTLYYVNNFGDSTDTVFSSAYTNIKYIIRTETRLQLFNSAGVNIVSSTNNILKYKPTNQATIYNNSRLSDPLFEVKIRNIKTYIDDPDLSVYGNTGTSIITDSINLSNLSDDSAPIKFTVNIYDVLSFSAIKLNTESLILNRPVLVPILITNLRHIQLTCNIVELIDKTLVPPTNKYNSSFGTLTNSNLYCNVIVELYNNVLNVNPYYRNNSYLVYIDVYDTTINAISKQLVYKFTELPVL